MFRAYRDVFRLPLKYLLPGKSYGFLPNGEKYGFLEYDDIPSWLSEDDISYLPSELKHKKEGRCFVFGTFSGNADIPLEIPNDPLAARTTFLDDPETLAKTFATKAHWREILSFIILTLGIGLNCLFIALIISFVLM
jgi:hypothetical protein